MNKDFPEREADMNPAGKCRNLHAASLDLTSVGSLMPFPRWRRFPRTRNSQQGPTARTHLSAGDICQGREGSWCGYRSIGWQAALCLGKLQQQLTCRPPYGSNQRLFHSWKAKAEVSADTSEETSPAKLFYRRCIWNPDWLIRGRSH